MNRYIYLLWFHGEDGPEDLKATHNRDNLIQLVESYNSDGWFERINTDPIKVLITLLELTDQELSEGDGVRPLTKGWGGLHLQTVKCFE